MTANEARKLAESKSASEYLEVMKQIEDAAKDGKFSIFIYKPLSNACLTRIRVDGYTVNNAPSIAIQKDTLYHTISW